jgi:hypothetical protein
MNPTWIYILNIKLGIWSLSARQLARDNWHAKFGTQKLQTSFHVPFVDQETDDDGFASTRLS